MFGLKLKKIINELSKELAFCKELLKDSQRAFDKLYYAKFDECCFKRNYHISGGIEKTKIQVKSLNENIKINFATIDICNLKHNIDTDFCSDNIKINLTIKNNTKENFENKKIKVTFANKFGNELNIKCKEYYRFSNVFSSDIELFPNEETNILVILNDFGYKLANRLLDENLITKILIDFE